MEFPSRPSGVTISGLEARYMYVPTQIIGLDEL
jgi:hypothetical protein